MPATRAADLESVRPYDLRHSFASLVLAEGLSVVEVARQAGHSPMMAMNTYGHGDESFIDDRARECHRP
jgi:integrase